MPSYEELTKRARSLLAMLGLTEPEFRALLPLFKRAFVAYMCDGSPHSLIASGLAISEYKFAYTKATIDILLHQFKAQVFSSKRKYIPRCSGLVRIAPQPIRYVSEP
jgi:hypothetical protein